MTDPLWSGRFEAGMHETMLDLTRSVELDIRLLPQDLRVTKAHARVLSAAGLLDSGEVDAIDGACDAVLAEWVSGTLAPEPGDEDVHSFVERELTKRLGETGAKIHAGRSRNDLVAADLRLWCKEQAARLAGSTRELIAEIVTLADAHVETTMPGYTHLQPGQPVSLAFHLLAHGFSLLRDVERFESAGRSASVSALGAGALAGTTLPLDPSLAASELGLDGLFDNAMDAVSDRDFACDLVYAIALCGVHLSRMGEEIVLWSSAEFGFATLDDRWSSGSSMMPQKRNPDLAELIRGRAAGGIADLTGLLVLLKGLPLAYDRDLQEDKSYLFSAVDRVEGALVGMRHLLGSLTFRDEAMLAAASRGGSWATDVAEALVTRGMPFRDAHRVVGQIVSSLERDGRDLGALTEDELKGFHPSLTVQDLDRVDPALGMGARNSHGGTSPASVRKQIELLRSETLSG